MTRFIAPVGPARHRLVLRSLLTIPLALSVLLIVSCASVGADPASKLVGRWRSESGVQTAEYSFAANGSFTGTVAISTAVVADFTGKWSLKEGAILYEYTRDKMGFIPAGTKDRDKLLSIAPDHFMIEAADGSRRKYVRAEPDSR